MLSILTCYALAIGQAQTQSRVVSLAELDLSAIAQDFGSPMANKSVDGKPLTIGGVQFSKGVGTHAGSSVEFALNKNALSFSAMVGVDSETGKQGSVRFTVLVDSKTAYDSGVMRGGDAAKKCEVSLVGAKVLTLLVEDGGDGINYDHADWADATLVLKKNAPKPTGAKIVEVPIKLAPVDLNRTEFHGPKAVGGTPGREFVFRIPVTGKSPVKVEVSGLPQGLVFDAAQHTIRGVVPPRGEYSVNVTASGPGGRDRRTLKIMSGKDMLARTPPMGWNSWNVWGTAVDANKVRAAADSIVQHGLADFGYQYVNIDDAWEAGRNAAGEIETNSKFENMNALSTYIHSKGLRFGIYSSPGPQTCGGYEGSYRHEEQDANSYAKWGVDYLKYDWCSYGGIEPRPDLAGHKYPYIKIKRALESTNRDIVLSMCQYGMGDVYKWGQSVGGSLWRTTGDINDSWGSMAGIGFDHSVRSTYVKPGGWNDPDMLVVGWLGWGPNIRPSNLKPAEQVTHITLWSMLAAPLLIGCDLTKLDKFTLELLCNHDVIEVDQDALGHAASRVWKEGNLEIWSRPLADGGTAVALFNRGRDTAKISAPVSKFVKGGSALVRNLWLRKNAGRQTQLVYAVPAHGAVMLKLSN